MGKMNFIYYSEIEEIVNSVIENSRATEFERTEILDMIGAMPRYLQSILMDNLTAYAPVDVRELRELVIELRENYMHSAEI